MTNPFRPQAGLASQPLWLVRGCERAHDWSVMGLGRTMRRRRQLANLNTTNPQSAPASSASAHGCN